MLTLYSNLHKRVNMPAFSDYGSSVVVVERPELGLYGSNIGSSYNVEVDAPSDMH